MGSDEAENMSVSECSDRPILAPCGLEGINYQVDPYVGCEHCCYYCYVLDRAETDWTQEIRIHKRITEQLREELVGIAAQAIYMGYETDPYQPSEQSYRQTRMVLELLLEKGFSASILTKSDLVTRDLDVLQEMDGAAVSVSVAFNGNHIRRHFEANTMDTEVRIEALRTMKEAGVKTGALLCPVIPYITDAKELVDVLTPHADTIWIYGLSVKARTGQNWRNVERILKTHFPDLADQIQDVVFSPDHAYWTQLREELVKLKNDRGQDLRVHL